MNQKVNRLPLAQLKVGQQGTIVSVGGERNTRRRLMDMGLVAGETITVKAVAPLGDPIEFLVKGYCLSLRRQEVSHILVEVAE